MTRTAAEDTVVPCRTRDVWLMETRRHQTGSTGHNSTPSGSDFNVGKRTNEWQNLRVIPKKRNEQNNLNINSFFSPICLRADEGSSEKSMGVAFSLFAGAVRDDEAS